MKEAAVATQQNPVTPAPAPERESVLQRKCPCGGGAAGIIGVCKECDRKRLTVQRFQIGRTSLLKPVSSALLSNRDSWQATFPHHSFSNIRVHSVAPRRLQLKHAAGNSTGTAELEADQATEQITGLSLPELPPVPAFNGRHSIPRNFDRPRNGVDAGSSASSAANSMNSARGQTGALGLLVEDGTKAGPGQMTKGEFIDQLEAALHAAADLELARVGRSSERCPYLEKWLGYYRTRSSEYDERVLRRYAPEAAGVSSARDYIPLVAARVQRAVAVWARTGNIVGVPDGLTEQFAGGGLPRAVGGSLSGGMNGGSEVLEESRSATAGIFAKAREGGINETDDPDHIQSQLGGGQYLESGVRSRMERAFGHDFGNVRVHADAGAAQLSANLNARAFTIGSDVAFSAGEYRPGTLIGDALIAHELAHVVQQGDAQSSGAPMPKNGDGRSDVLEEDADVAAVGAVASIWGGLERGLAKFSSQAMPRLRSGLQLRRCSSGPNDYEIRGLPKLQDRNSVYFDRKTSKIEESQKERVEDLKSPPGRDVRLFSFISEDENIPPDKGKELAHKRYQEVDKALRRNPNAHTGKQELGAEDTTSSRGSLRYRDWRKVAVVPASDKSSGQKDCSGGGEQPCSDESKFTDAQAAAGPLLTPAITVLNTPLNDKAKGLIDKHFHTKTDEERDAIAPIVQANLTKVKSHIATQMSPIGTRGAKPGDRKPGHVCANECDPTCSSPDAGASNNGVDDKALMTLCDTDSKSAFMKEPDVKERAITLIHEGMHGISLSLPSGAKATPGKGAIDYSYFWQRLITFLDTETAIKNNDSYVLFVREANGETPKIGPEAEDPEFMLGDEFLSKGETVAVERALAWLSGWLLWAQQEVAQLYRTIIESRRAGSWTNQYYEGTMDRIAALFEMTKPPALPTDKDQVKVAAIQDRLFRLSRLLFKTVELKKVSKDSTKWGEGPNSELTIGPDFFKDKKTPRSPRSQLDFLMARMLEASPDISKDARSKYAKMLDLLRQHKSGGSP